MTTTIGPKRVYGPALEGISMTFGILALMVASLFTGAAIYVSVV